MKRPVPLFVGLVGIVVMVGIVWLLIPPAPSPRNGMSASENASISTASTLGIVNRGEPQDPVRRDASPESPTVPKGASAAGAEPDLVVIEEKIAAAALSYDAEAVRVISPYLKSPVAAVRKLAVQGLIRAGDPSAGPVLRASSATLTNPREVVEFLDAAEFLELPSLSSARKSLRASKAAEPSR